MSEPLDLTVLVTRLRSAGLKTDVRQFLAAHELLLAMAAHKPALQDDPEALASHLGPIFCGSPEEQQLFRQEILAWRGAPRPPPPPAVPPTIRRRNPLRQLAIAGVAAGVVGVAGVYWWQSRPVPLPPPPPPGPVTPTPEPKDAAPIKSSFVVSRPEIGTSDDVEVIRRKEVAVPWLTILAGGLGSAALAFLALWWRHKRRRDFVLSRMAPDPDTGRIELNPAPPTLTNIRPIALRRISAGLRRTRANEVFDLSVSATVNETARSGGFVVPVFAPRVAIPEYLVLIDRRSASDHGAQLVYGWVSQLCNQGVAADCYEFDSDPRVCREFGTQRSHRLSALLARHHRATVFLCAESAVGIDPLTHRPQPWLRSFNSLPGRVFLTPAPPYRWAGHEHQLTLAGFIVAPASPVGLHVVAAMDRKSLEAIGAGAKYAREFPRLLAQDTLSWLERAPPPEATVARLLRALRDFLGPDGYSWLCACAVYPQVSWPITLKLLDALLPAGADLPTRRAIDEQLPSIARLPWFRYGYMPDWLRRLLIAQLDPESETRIRSMLEQLVCSLLDGKEGDQSTRGQDSSPLLIRTRLKALEIARNAPDESPLQDEVFLDFLAGASPDPLSLRLSSLPFAGAPRPRSLGTRLRERWRAVGVRQPLLVRSAMSLLAAVPVSIILWATLRDTPQAPTVPDSDITYELASSDLSSSGTMVAIAPNGQFMLLASQKAGKFMEVWDLARNVARNRLEMAQPRDFIISPRSDRVAVLDDEGEISFWSVAGNLEMNSLGRITHLAASRLNGKDVSLKFNSDATLLMIQDDYALTIYETETSRQVSKRTGFVDTVTIDPDDPSRFLAFKSGTLVWLPADRIPDEVAFRELGGQKVTFSLDARNLARESMDPQTRAWQIELQDTRSGDKRAEMTLPPESTPLGWVWSGDGNLVAYEEGRGVNVVYNLATDQELMKGESKLPATNRLYTIRFARSEQRRPNYTYYELAERTIDVVTAEDASPNVDTSNNAQESPTPPASLMDKITEKINQEVLATLDPDMRVFARRLIAQAAGQGIAIRLTDGRVKAKFVSHGKLREDSLALHEAGRAFDYSVLSDNGLWITNDVKRMSVVGQIGKSLGLTWGGDVDASGFLHFELPEKTQTPPEGSDQVTAGNDRVLATLERETSARARQLLGLTSKAGVTVAIRPPGKQIRHRSDISQKLDFTGRAFDIAVLMPNGAWSTSDFSTLSQVGQLATGIGFEWSGDWGYGQYSHFELPQPSGSRDGRPRLAKTEFSYRKLMPGYDGYTQEVRTSEGDVIGSFELTAGPAPANGQPARTLEFVALQAWLTPLTDASPTEKYGVGIKATEFLESKETTKSIDLKTLRFTLTLEGAELVKSADGLAFDRDTLRVRIDVQPGPPPAKAK